MTLLKAYIGSGLLALPYAFMMGGWFLSLVIFSISCIVIIKCVNLVMEVANAYQDENIDLTKLCEIVYGKVGLILSRVFLISY
jgi:proton-coupled amino acid transporter